MFALWNMMIIISSKSILDQTYVTYKATKSEAKYYSQMIISIFTHYSPLIQPSLAWSKWNMGEICGLKFHLIYVHTSQKNWNPTMRKEYNHFRFKNKWKLPDHRKLQRRVFARSPLTRQFLGPKWRHRAILRLGKMWRIAELLHSLCIAEK